MDTATTRARPAVDSVRDRQSGKTSPIPRLSSTVADPSAPAYIAAVMIVEAGPLLEADGRLRIAVIRSRLERRLSRLPQLKRRASFSGLLQGRPVWVDDDGFAIERHIRQGAVAVPGDEAQLLTLAQRILRAPLDRAHPPWELWFLTGLPGGRLAVLVKLHHAIADGLGAVQMMKTLFDAEPDAPDPRLLPWTPAPAPTGRALLLDNLTGKASAVISALRALGHPGQLAAVFAALRHTFAMRTQAPTTSFNRPMPSGSTTQARVLHMELEPAHAAAHEVGATVNDVLLDVAAGGLRALLLGRGERVTGLELLAMVPVTMRSPLEARALGNAAGFMIVPLPIGEPDPQRALQLIGASTRRAKAEQSAAYSQALGALSVASATVAPAFMAHQRFMNLVATNVPGPTAPLYLLAARVLEVIPLLSGLLGGNVTVCFCAVSYAGQLNLTVIADATAVPDIDCLLQGMATTWHRLAGERVPVPGR